MESAIRGSLTAPTSSDSVISSESIREMEDHTHMHAKNIPHMDGVNSEMPNLTNRFDAVSNDSKPSNESFPVIWLLITVPLMTLLGETSIFVAAAVFLVAVIRLIIAGFREHPIWGILNLIGFYYPILWVAFGLTHWKKTKRELTFAAVAGACIYYLSRQQGITF